MTTSRMKSGGTSAEITSLETVALEETMGMEVAAEVQISHQAQVEMAEMAAVEMVETAKETRQIFGQETRTQT